MKKYILFFVLQLTSISIYPQLFFNEVSSSFDFNHSYFQGVSGAGLSFADFNNDGLDDISIPTNNDNSLIFFQNNGTKLIPQNFNIDFPVQIKQVTLGYRTVGKYQFRSRKVTVGYSHVSVSYTHLTLPTILRV